MIGSKLSELLESAISGDVRVFRSPAKGCSGNLLKIGEILAPVPWRSMESYRVSVRIATLTIWIELKAQSEVEKEFARKNRAERTAGFGLEVWVTAAASGMVARSSSLRDRKRAAQGFT
jgi:hypothetical protein